MKRIHPLLTAVFLTVFSIDLAQAAAAEQGIAPIT